MSEFAGIVRHDTQVVSPESVAALARPFSSDAVVTWADGPVALIQDRSGRFESGPALKLPERGPLTLVGDVRIDNLGETARRTSLLSQITHVEHLLEMFERRGRDVLKTLTGDFAFAVWDAAERSLFCARDHFGVRPFYYASTHDFFAFSSDIRSLTGLAEPLRELDRRRVAEFLEGLPPDEDRTFYEEVKRLPRGHLLRLSDVSVELACYWNPELIGSDPSTRSEDDCMAEFHDAFLESVRCRIPDSDCVSTFLSGGLDSSSVTCAAREMLPRERRLRAFSAIFPGIEEPHRSIIDERPYIDAVCEVDGIESHRMEGDRLTPLSGIREILEIHGQPVDPPNAYLDFALYRMAAEAGSCVVLDGLEGDIGISHGIHYLDELAHSRRWRRFVREARGLEKRLHTDVARVFRQYGLPHLSGLRAKEFAYSTSRLLFSGQVRFAARAVRSRLGKRRGGPVRPVLPVASPSLLESVGMDLAPYEDPIFPSEREAHLAHLGKPYVPSILEFTHRNARSFGLDARHPLFDVRLVACAVNLPPQLKLRDGWTRYVLREAVAGIVPDLVRWRAGKASLSPNFDLRMARDERKRALEILDGSAARIGPFVEMSTIMAEIEQNRFTRVWPVLVLALFLEKNFSR